MSNKGLVNKSESFECNQTKDEETNHDSKVSPPPTTTTTPIRLSGTNITPKTQSNNKKTLTSFSSQSCDDEQTAEWTPEIPFENVCIASIAV